MARITGRPRITLCSSVFRIEWPGSRGCAGRTLSVPGVLSPCGCNRNSEGGRSRLRVGMDHVGQAVKGSAMAAALSSPHTSRHRWYITPNITVNIATTKTI